MRGEPEVQRVNVGGFGFEGRLEVLDVTRDDDLLPKVLWDDRKYRSVATIIYMAKGMLDL